MFEQSVEYKGYTIEIEQDSDPQNPRTEWENLGTMYCFHKRYTMGDEHKLTLSEAVKMEQSKDFISLPIYMYDHSGVTINTTPFSCQWDSGKLGFIAVSKEKVRKDYSWKVITKARIEKIKEYLLNEVKTYDDFLTGNVYGYNIKDSEGNAKGSSWGYFTSDHEENGLLEQAKSEIDCDIKMELEKNKDPNQMELELV
jgi:hypothetical protein